MKTMLNFSAALILAALLMPSSTGAVSLGQSIDVKTSASLNSSTSANTQLNASASVNSSASATDSQASSSSKEVIRLEKNSSGIEIILPTQVSTEEDLNIYQKNSEVRDENISKIDTEVEDGVSVEYKHPGRLFGIIPVEVIAKTTVKAQSDGKLKTETTFPWWSSMVRGLGDVRAQVDGTISSQFANVMTNGTTASVLRARLIDAIVRANAEARANASIYENTDAKSGALNNASTSVQTEDSLNIESSTE